MEVRRKVASRGEKEGDTGDEKGGTLSKDAPRQPPPHRRGSQGLWG